MATSNGSNGDGITRAPCIPAEDFDSPGDELSRKRKSAGVNESHGASPDAVHGPLKKAKMDEAVAGPAPHGQPPGIPPDRSVLPVEIWLHIFTFCPPRTLGNLLRVNKLFNSCLDPFSRVAVKKPSLALSLSASKTMTPQLIWQNARRSFWPNMPGPLENKSEIDMWRLSCSSTCEFCGRRDTRTTLPATDPLLFGPGSDGVAPIWAFRVRCCGVCLLRRSMKEMEFLLSEGSSFLMPALPFIFVTPDPCLIPLSIIDRVQLPSVSLSKLFWTADVEGLRQEFVSVKELGAPAVEEWQKGLSTRGADQRANIAKWEKFAESGGVANMRTLLYPGYRPQQSLPVAHARPGAAKATNLPVVRPELRNDISSHPLLAVQSENTQHTTHTAAKNVVPKIATPAVSTAENLRPIQGVDARRQGTTGENIKDTKEATDADWDEIQGPVRLKILKYADEAIIGDWDDGEKVTKNNAPSFAADVLLHVRNRFYRQVEKDAADALAAGRKPIVDPPQGPFTQKLTLENMKYVFDVKVKPLTEKLDRRELFLCHVCDYNARFFGFEGVVQHYASKHTSALSVGNVVVYWRAEWPETSPFKPNPRPPKNKSLQPHRANPPSSTNHTISKPLPTTRRSNNGRVSPGVLNVHPRTAPQQSYPTSGPSHVYEASSFGISSAAVTPHYPHGSSYSQVGSFEPSHPPTTQPPIFQQLPHPPPPHTSPPLLPVASRIQLTPTVAPPVSYAMKLDQTAKWAGELWQLTGKGKPLPVSLRLYLVIYHLDKKFRSSFQERLPLSLFIDGLSKHNDMQPLRNINALFCRACQLDVDGGAASMGKSTEFSMPQLASHFQSKHASRKKKPQNSPPLDWITDMLFLPRQHLLRDMLSPDGTLFPQEAINHLLGRRQEREHTRDSLALQQKAEVVPDDGYSPQYNVASLSLPETSAPPRKHTKRNSDDHGHHGTTARMERQQCSRDKSKSAYQPNQNGHGVWQRQAEPGGLRIKGRGTAQKPEIAEERERQQEEEIRAMWAADRVQTAKAQSSTSAPLAIKRTTQPQTQHALRDGDQSHKARLRSENVVFKEEDRSSPGLRGIPIVSKKAAPLVAEEPDLLDALETHLNETQEPDVLEARAATPMRHPTTVPAAYVGEWDQEKVVHHEPYLRQTAPYEDERRARYAIDTRRPEAEYPRERPQSPMRQAINPRMVVAMEYDANGRRSSLAEGHRYAAGESPYETRTVVDGEAPDGYARARSRPVPYYDYAYGYGYDRVGYREGTRRVLQPVERPVAYEVYQPYEVVEDYEMVRVVHPGGDYYVRRPLRRERLFTGALEDRRAAEQARHYYSEAPPPPSWPSMAAVPAAYEANGRVVERRRDYSGVPAPLAASYDTEMSGRGRDRAPGPTDGRGDADAGVGGYYEEEYDPRQPAALVPGEGRWPMRYQ